MAEIRRTPPASPGGGPAVVTRGLPRGLVPPGSPGPTYPSPARPIEIERERASPTARTEMETQERMMLDDVRARGAEASAGQVSAALYRAMRQQPERARAAAQQIRAKKEGRAYPPGPLSETAAAEIAGRMRPGDPNALRVLQTGVINPNPWDIVDMWGYEVGELIQRGYE